MLRISALSLCFAIIFIGILGINFAHASKQEQHIGFNSGIMYVTVVEDNPMIFGRSYYAARLYRDPYNPATKLTIRFSNLGNVTGCASMTDFVVKSTQKKTEMQVENTDREIERDWSKTRYSNYDCEIMMNEAYFDVPLDVTQLTANNIKKISVKSTKYGSFMDVNVDATPQKITFSTAFKDIPGMPTLKTSGVYWLYPPRTVILYAPSAKAGQDVIPQLKEFAVQKGLKPIEQILPGFTLADSATNYYFFFDPTGDIRDKITSPDDSLPVGKMTVSRTVYGANGPVEEPMSLDVHASMPGMDQ